MFARVLVTWSDVVKCLISFALIGEFASLSEED